MGGYVTSGFAWEIQSVFELIKGLIPLSRESGLFYVRILKRRGYA
jgi:hypothetical protein